MLRKAASIMPRLFFVFGVVWLLIAQAMFVVSLRDIDSDQPKLFHSRVLHWVLWRVLNVVGLGSVAAVAVGLLLLAIVLVF